MNNTRKIFIVLFLIVLLPALFYSVYEISALNESEEMISQIYQRQLDAILFSINQYVLDIASGWATQIENDIPHSQIERIIQSNPSIISIIISDTSLSNVTIFPSRQLLNRKLITSQREMIERLVRYQAASYRKLEPVIESDSTTIIFFVSPLTLHVIGIVIDNEHFINNIIEKKLIEIAQNDFIVAVGKLSNGSTIFATSSEQDKIFSQQRQLWIFPDHIIKIRLKGTTIQDAAKERFNRNILLIILMDVTLIFGAWFIFRTISREMELVAMKSDFVSNVSHELRTPLSLIRMFAETLEMGRVKTEKKKREYYTTIVNETDRLTRLINNILNFSRMESNTRRYNFNLIQLNDIAASVISIYSYRLKQLSFTVETSLADNLPKIFADDEAIAEALHNLFDNAIKYSRENKFLRIATSLKQNSITIEVEDHGIGISSVHHSKIFEKFYRVSHGLVHTAKGSGLGLAIVQHIVHSHNGTISVVSEPQHGSKFIITLPLTQPT
jgi:two-component system phosphate regulon sensor histidine kinase PhoR